MKKIDKNQKHYLSNKDLYAEIIVSKAQGRLTRKAEHMIILLGKNVIKKMYYKDPDDKHDCFQEAMFDVFRGWHNFDEEKGDNCFAYYTEIIKRGLAKGWNSTHKTKGADVEIISISGVSHDGELYDRF
jgi:DNA-directed RNA polymerase specialized sigma24 family protein